MPVVIAITSLLMFMAALCAISLVVLCDLAKDSLEPVHAFGVHVSAVMGVLMAVGAIAVL